MRALAPPTLLLLCLTVVACGTTEIRTGDPTAAIFVDGEHIGDGSASITRTGLPRSSDVTVKRNGQPVATREVSRRFTAVTLLAGLFTAYTGFIWAWQYPDEVVFDLPAARPGAAGWDAVSAWEKKVPSAWDKPLGQGNE